MTPIIVKGNQRGYVIYTRPSMRSAIRQMEATDGIQFDPIERHPVRGGVPVPMERVPMVFDTREAAEQSLKTAA